MSEASKQNLKVSREGIVLIKSFEGFRPRAERRDPDGWIIGYGHALSAREGASVSEADAELLLHYDLIPVSRAINDGVGGAVNQHQFDALASFAFSVGVERFNASDVLQRLNAGAADEAADALAGWPEPILPSTALRRRAAERALFVADPTSPVALADLLSAPLISPTLADPAPEPVSEPALGPDAIDAAWEDVAPNPPEPTTDNRAATATEIETVGDTSTEHEATAAPAEPAEDPMVPPTQALASFSVAAQTAMQQRYSPYAAAVVGPLPGLHLARTYKPEPVVEPTAEPEVLVPFTDLEPVQAAPGGAPEPVSEAVPESPLADAAESIDDSPIQTPVFESPFAPPPPPDLGLVLTPSGDEPALSAPRLVWPHDDAADADQAPLFEDEGALSRSARPPVGHETGLDEPARFQWGETGAYVIMGGFGLVSFGMSMAAFRLASQRQSGTDETTIIAWVLAVIGAACVGVSAYNLYRRIGRADD